MFQQFFDVNAIGASIDDIIDVDPLIVECNVCSDDFVQDSDWTWEHMVHMSEMFAYDRLERLHDGDEESDVDEQFNRDFDDDRRRQFALENVLDKDTLKAYATCLERAIAITGTEHLSNRLEDEYTDEDFDRDHAELHELDRRAHV